MLTRSLAPLARTALEDTPAVWIVGPRQAGKSTLVQGLSGPSRSYLTLDDPTQLAAAVADPTGYIAGLGDRVTIDEVQKAPELLAGIKASIDRDRRPGRFLLTGSADVLALPRLSSELVGRVEVLTLWPFSQLEIAGHADASTLIDTLFEPEPPRLAAESSTWRRRAVVGGYPEVVRRTTRARRDAWLASYVSTMLAREVRDLSDVDGVVMLPRLLRLVAARVTGLLNVAEMSRSLAMPHATLGRYLALLEALFLVRPLPAWSGNLSRRLAKAPKLHLVDTGLLAHLLALDDAQLRDTRLEGALLESFVVSELRKHATVAARRTELFHFRSHDGTEVDVVIEDGRGHVVGVEVKASRTLRAEDLVGLRSLGAALGARWHRGVVLYGGSEVVSFGPRLHAVPISALWEPPARPPR